MNALKKITQVSLVIFVVLVAIILVGMNQLKLVHAADRTSVHKASPVNLMTDSVSDMAESSSMARAQTVQGLDVPPAIQVPQGNKLAAQAFGKGVQIYACPATANSAATPFTVLFDSNQNGANIIGTHYAINNSLIWEDLVGSSVVAVPQATAPSPNPNSIPQVLLKAQAHLGNKNSVLNNVSFIQRVNTNGGLPSAAGCMHNNQAQESVPFTTQYLFYVPTSS